MSKYGILIHGGAGKKTHDPRIVPVLRKVIDSSRSMLKDGMTAVDVSVNAVSMMEDSRVFNAGAGSYPTRNGTVQMDAGVMDGKTMDCGGVACITDVKNPIQVAKRVMNNSEHSLIVGTGAFEFAMLEGFSKFPIRPAEAHLKKTKAMTGEKYGTVGSVVIDGNGNLAAAVSTGGLPNQVSGRVGDSAIVCSGYYAENHTGAAVTTGNGDVILKTCLAKKALDLVGSGESPQCAAEKSISCLGALKDGLGGIIMLDDMGNHGVACNTEMMHHAYWFEGMSQPVLSE